MNARLRRPDLLLRNFYLCGCFVRNGRYQGGRGRRLVAARILFLVGSDIASARAQSRVATVWIQRRLHRHAATLSSHSVGREFPGVDTGRVCLQQSSVKSQAFAGRLARKEILKSAVLLFSLLIKVVLVHCSHVRKLLLSDKLFYDYHSHETLDYELFATGNSEVESQI